MLLYYITDRRQLPAPDQRGRLLEKIAEAARCGVDYVQLREKDLPTAELERLAREAVAAVRSAGGRTLLLINSRTDVALACGADGVHLPATDVSPGDARATWDRAMRHAPDASRRAVVAVSCHTSEEVRLAESQGADFAVFGPVFEKSGTVAPGGLEALRAVCRRGAPPDRKTESVASGAMPVLALGGVTLENARACVQAGAAGIAAIRLFQENDVSRVVRELRGT